MKDKTYHYVTGIIFAVLATVHAYRVYSGWEAVVAGWEVPISVSVLAVLIAAPLSIRAFKKYKK
jgi:hypothetical protein